MHSLCTLRDHCRQWPRNTRYQADATPYLGRTSTGWIAPALPGALIQSPRPSSIGGISRLSALPVLRFHEEKSLASKRLMFGSSLKHGLRRFSQFCVSARRSAPLSREFRIQSALIGVFCAVDRRALGRVRTPTRDIGRCTLRSIRTCPKLRAG